MTLYKTNGTKDEPNMFYVKITEDITTLIFSRAIFAIDEHCFWA